MPSEKVNESTKREWRELGFYYDYDEHAKLVMRANMPDRYVGVRITGGQKPK